MKKGKLTKNGVKSEPHEQKTIDFLLELGHNVSLIPKSNRTGENTADLILDSKEEWEMKSPTGKGKYIFQNTIQDAVSQANNIIIDIRRMDLPREKIIREFKKEFINSKKAKKMLIITKKRELLEFRK